MLVRLNPEYKLVCDRCGKVTIPTEEGVPDYHTVGFTEVRAVRIKTKEGHICEECTAEFWEFANNFFDEVNMERSENDNT